MFRSSPNKDRQITKLKRKLLLPWIAFSSRPRVCWLLMFTSSRTEELMNDYPRGRGCRIASSSFLIAYTCIDTVLASKYCSLFFLSCVSVRKFFFPFQIIIYVTWFSRKWKCTCGVATISCALPVGTIIDVALGFWVCKICKHIVQGKQSTFLYINISSEFFVSPLSLKFSAVVGRV